VNLSITRRRPGKHASLSYYTLFCVNKYVVFLYLFQSKTPKSKPVVVTKGLSAHYSRISLGKPETKVGSSYYSGQSMMFVLH